MNQKGSILILALWAVSLLAVMAVSIGAGVRQKLTLVNRLEQADEAHALAAAGVEKARSVLRVQDLTETYDKLTEDWASSKGFFKEVPLANGTFSVTRTFVNDKTGEKGTAYGLTDEQSKLNLNIAEAETLTRLFKIAGMEGDDAIAAGFAVVDWRDSDSTYQHPDFGAEDADYAEMPKPYEAKDAPFQAVEELLLVKGISREIFDKIEKFVTVTEGAVNANTAPKEVLLAMGMSEILTGKILDYRAGPDKLPQTEDDLHFTAPENIFQELSRFIAVDAAEEAVLNNLVSAGQLGTSSAYFTAHSRGTLKKTGGFVDIQAVMDRNGKIYKYRSSRIQWPSPASN